jgi:hypothetical protein
VVLVVRGVLLWLVLPSILPGRTAWMKELTRASPFGLIWYGRWVPL